MEAAEKRRLVETHGAGPGDTGSTEVQVVLFTSRIRELTEHLKRNKSDHSCRRSLLKMVGRRRRLLAYLRRRDPARCARLIETLGLRG